MPRPLNRTPADSQRGIVLPAVLWLVLVLSLVASMVLRLEASERKLAAREAAAARARAAADAVIAMSVAAVAAHDANLPLDGSWNPVSFDGITVDVSVQDELGKLDLNAAPAEALRAFFIGLSIDPTRAAALADAVADWRDEDDLRRLNGAERDDYARAGLAYGPRNAPLESVAEFGQVLGVDRETLERSLPYLTVLSHRPMPDGATAPDLLRRALHLPGPLPTNGAGGRHRISAASVPDLTGRAFTVIARARNSGTTWTERRATIRFVDNGTARPWIHEWR